MTRYGIRHLRPNPFTHTEGPSLPRLSIREIDREVIGVCGLLAATHFSDGTVRPHENTLTLRLERQRGLVTADRAALGKPILLTTPTLSPLRPLLPAPAESGTVNFSKGLARYALHHAPCASPIPLDQLGTLIIADGHHRAYTHAALAAEGREDFGLIPVVVIGADELRIGIFLRLIDGEGRRPGEVIDTLLPFFEINEIVRPEKPGKEGEWLLSYRGQHYRLRRRGSDSKETDAGWLHRTVLPRAFGIVNTRTDPRIRSVDVPPETDGAISFDPAGAEQIKLLGRPMAPKRFFAEVEAGRVLPPKSTRFEPRVPSGLLVWIP